MNDVNHPSIGEAELRMALRGLRRDAEPGHDLWPAIATRIAATPQETPVPAMRRNARWLAPMALAPASTMLETIREWW